MRGLQERMEQAYKDGTLAELDPEAFKDFATDIHSEVYLENGFADLPVSEQVAIARKLFTRKAFESTGTWLELGEMMGPLLWKHGSEFGPPWWKVLQAGEGVILE